MKRRSITTAALGTLILASSVFAQGPGGTPPTGAQIVANRVARLTALLTLTSAQQASATTLFTDEQTAAAPIQASMGTAHTALQAAVKANDTAGINTQATQIGALTTQQTEIRSKAEAAFYAILTPDQVTKYSQIGSRGPGGFGRGPGGPL